MVTLTFIKNTMYFKLWSIPGENVYYVLVRSDLYLKLQGVTIKKSHQATLSGTSHNSMLSFDAVSITVHFN